MHLHKPLILLATFLGGALARSRSIPPFYYIGSGKVDLASPNYFTIKGPLGNRISDKFSGGTLTDHHGKRIAEFVNGTGAENGIIDSNGFLHVDVRSTWVFADGEPAYITFQGIGSLGQNNWLHLGVESGTTKYGYLNKIFIFGNSTITPEAVYLDFWSPIDPDAAVGNSTKIAIVVDLGEYLGDKQHRAARSYRGRVTLTPEAGQLRAKKKIGREAANPLLREADTKAICHPRRGEHVLTYGFRNLLARKVGTDVTKA